MHVWRHVTGHLPPREPLDQWEAASRQQLPLARAGGFWQVLAACVARRRGRSTGDETKERAAFSLGRPWDSPTQVNFRRLKMAPGLAWSRWRNLYSTVQNRFSLVYLGKILTDGRLSNIELDICNITWSISIEQTIKYPWPASQSVKNQIELFDFKYIFVEFHAAKWPSFYLLWRKWNELTHSAQDT